MFLFFLFFFFSLCFFFLSFTEFKPSVSDKPPTEGKNKTGLIVGLVVSGTLVVLLSAPLVFYLARRRRLTKDDNGILKSILIAFWVP